MSNPHMINRCWPEHEFAYSIESPAEKTLIRRIILMLSLAILLLLIWSVFTKVNEVSKSRGQVIPLGHRQVVQNEAGGTLESVRVKEGDVIKKGTVLARFVSTDTHSAVDALLSQQAHLQLNLALFQAINAHSAPDFSEFAHNYPQLVEQHIATFKQMELEHQAQEAFEQSDIDQIQAQLDGVNAEVPALLRQIDTAKQTLGMLKKLERSQTVSRLKLLNAKQKVNAYQIQLNQLKTKQDTLKQDLVKATEKHKLDHVSRHRKIDDEISDIQAKLLDIDAKVEASKLAFSQDTVRSPIAGIVQSISSSSAGSVIKPGGTVAVIIPMTETGLMEVKLSPRDIGFVKVGQTAQVKVDAFDYSRYGALEGVVSKISPSTDSNEKGGVYYKVQIALDKPYFGDSPHKLALLPGMTGEADIITGRKTIFQYLWKPVFTNVSNAFGER